KSKMWLNRVMLLLVAAGMLGSSQPYNYSIEFEDYEIFSECRNQPDGVLGINGLADFTELTIDSQTQMDKLKISGNATLKWDIQQTDRVQIKLTLLKYYRQEWRPTIYEIFSPNFCSILFDENQYWYKSWGQYITNIKDVKDKCINVPGTKFIHKPFSWDLSIVSAVPNMDGEHKILIELSAFGHLNIKRPTSICYEMKVNIVKM
ncbi:hypothetical protein KR044_010772, partial [Drosophila immigrans]